MRAYLFITLVAAGCSSSSGDQVSCPTEAGDAGAQTPTATERCNAPGSMGASHYYKIFATAPADNLTVQLELWDNRGAFTGGAPHAGTFEIAGADADPATCGVCLRAQSDHGESTAMDFFATGGTVAIDQFTAAEGAMFSATITGASFDQIAADKTPVDGGCDTTVDNLAMAGTIVTLGGTGGGGGGGGGSGGNGCKVTVGDP
jgi:hypothetical protein